jgi:transglutaminase-like putative cysteine protease
MRAISLLAFLLTSSLYCQFYRIGEPDKWVNKIAIDGLKLNDTACSSGGVDHLLVDRQYNVAEEGIFVRSVTKLNTSEAVQNGSRVEVDIDPSYQELKLHWARVIRDGKVIEQLDPARITVLQRERDLNAFLYDGTRSIILELHDVRPGDIIDQAFTRTGLDAASDNRFYCTVPMGYSVPMARHHVRFVIPAGRTLRFKGHLFDDRPVITKSSWGQEHIYKRENVECILAENNVPDWFSPFPELQVTEFENLASLREWALDQFAVDMAPGKELQQAIDRLSLISIPEERIDSAIHLVQRQVRYLGLEDGISAYRPKPPSRVFQQRFGDCKDRSLLLVTMLRELGINAAPALVNTVSGSNLDQRLPHPGSFDHCIVAIEHDGTRYWVDPTDAHNGGGLKNRHTKDMGYALIIDRSAGKGFERMPGDVMSLVEITEEYTLDSLRGGAILEVETRYQHREADELRSWLAGLSNREVSEQYLNFYKNEYGEGELVEPVQIEDDIANNILVIKEHYRIPSIWDSVGVDQIETLIAPAFLKAYVDAPAQSMRLSPYRLPLPIEVTQKIIVNMPEDWPLDIAPQSIAGHGVQYESTIKTTGPLIEMFYRYRTEQRMVPSEEMPVYAAQQQRILDDLGMTFTYDFGAQEATHSRWKAIGILLFILAAGLLGAFTLYKWDPEPHPDSLHLQPTGIGGWMILPLLGLLASPVILLVDMFSENYILDAPLYVPFDGIRNKFIYHLFNYFTIIQNIGMLCLVLVTLVLFFQRRSNVPVLMKSIYLISFASLVIDMFMYDWLYINTVSGIEYNSSEVARSLVAALVWVPFFHFSRRVHTTFVRRSKHHIEPISLNKGSVAPVFME